MPKHEMLNNVDHINLRVITRKSKDYGDDVAGCLVFPPEFIDVHKEYPIYFQKDQETGAFQAVALFGFQSHENLFLDDSNSGWDAHYIPALIRREPFLIGFQPGQDAAEQTPKVMIDMESPRISHNEEGELLFREGGGNSPLLEETSKLLRLIHDGLTASNEMFETLLAYELVEPFTLEIKFDDGTPLKVTNYYTINQEKLYALDDAAIARLHKTGHLQLAYLVLASLGNVRRLIDRRNAMVPA